MTDFLTAVKSARTGSGSRGEDDDAQLTPVGSRNLKSLLKTNESAEDDVSKDDQPVGHEDSSKAASSSQLTMVAESPGDALHILRSQPGHGTLLAVLEQINQGRLEESFSLDSPGPIQAQIVNTMIIEIVPTFWPALNVKDGDVLISALKNLAGLNAIIARLRQLASQKTSAENINDLLDIANRIFAKDDMVLSICNGMHRNIKDRTKREMSWKELVTLVGSGKVVAAVAQAEDAASNVSKPSLKARPSWLANGDEYSAWLGQNIAKIATLAQSDDKAIRIEEASLLLAKGLQLGRPGQLLRGLLTSLTTNVQLSAGREQTAALMHALPPHAKRTATEQLLRWLSSSILPDTQPQESITATQDISTAAGLLSTIVKGDERMLQHLQTQISDPVLSNSVSLPARRACFAVLAGLEENDVLLNLLEKLISTFSSTIFIAHAPVAQQEGLAQSILLAAGYVHREAPMSLLMTARSSGHMQGVSNRLDSSNDWARWLGMVVGTALSKLVDKPGSQMSFGTEEVKSEEALWYVGLVDIKDTVGTLESFGALLQSRGQLQKALNSQQMDSKMNTKKEKTIDGKPVFGPPRPPPLAQTKIVGDRITEIVDDESDSDDLKPYAKPDSDPEDSDEDATLVNRNKPRAPVYIRELMAGLRDDQNFDRFSLCIKTAAALIRRKTGFGKEVTDHAEELTGMLSNLQDPFDMDDFDDMRLQALVAALLSDVKVVAPLLARQAFAEGYSIAQRCVLLSALGLGGRELAGFKIEDEDYNPKLSNSDFPSKKLPPRLHAIYGSTTSSATRTKRLEAASQSIEHQMIQPMALQAADQSTSHLNAVKVRTFSSRMDVEKARTKRKPPANGLAKCFGECFFFPLSNKYQQEISAYGSGSVFASAPFVLVTFIKTLALLLHASGPATLGLPQISAEMWDLLLSLRVRAIGDISILQAVLFALLTLLEINTDKQRIVQDHPKQLMETQQWVDLVFERMGSSGLVDDEGKSEEAKVRTLAAGVLMKCREIIEMYQKQLVGYDFSYQ